MLRLTRWHLLRPLVVLKTRLIASLRAYIYINQWESSIFQVSSRPKINLSTRWETLVLLKNRFILQIQREVYEIFTCNLLLKAVEITSSNLSISFPACFASSKNHDFQIRSRLPPLFLLLFSMPLPFPNSMSSGIWKCNLMNPFPLCQDQVVDYCNEHRSAAEKSAIYTGDYTICKPSWSHQWPVLPSSCVAQHIVDVWAHWLSSSEPHWATQPQ